MIAIEMRGKKWKGNLWWISVEMIGNELNYSIRMKTNNDNNGTLLNYIHLRLADWLTELLGWLAADMLLYSAQENSKSDCWYP